MPIKPERTKKVLKRRKSVEEILSLLEDVRKDFATGIPKNLLRKNFVEDTNELLTNVKVAIIDCAKYDHSIYNDVNIEEDDQTLESTKV
ncbi:MAG: hypothetical protein WCA84_05000 [Ignavibacteriaceae bacterium]